MFVFPPFLLKKQPLQFPSRAAAIILLRIPLSNSGFVFQYQFLNFSGLSWYFRKCYLTKERSADKHLFWCNIGPALHTTNETQMEDIPFTTWWSGENVAFFVSLLYTPFETSKVNVRRVGQDYLPRPCFCAFGAFGTWIEMVAGLGMILGATWQMMQMGPDRQNPTSGRFTNKVLSASLLSLEPH